MSKLFLAKEGVNIVKENPKLSAGMIIFFVLVGIGLLIGLIFLIKYLYGESRDLSSDFWSEVLGSGSFS